MLSYLTIEPPEVVPEFATDDLIDEASGVNNVIEATTEQKLNGWYPYKKRPERGVMNWLHRHTGLYCQYIKKFLVPEIDAGLFDHETRIHAIESKNHRHRQGTINLQMRVVDGHFSTASGGVLTETGEIDFDLDYQILNYDNLAVFTFKETCGEVDLGEYPYIGGNVVADGAGCNRVNVGFRIGELFPWWEYLWAPVNQNYFIGRISAPTSLMVPIKFDAISFEIYPPTQLFLIIDFPTILTNTLFGLWCQPLFRNNHGWGGS